MMLFIAGMAFAALLGILALFGLMVYESRPWKR